MIPTDSASRAEQSLTMEVILKIYGDYGFMKTALINATLVLAAFSLTACSNNPFNTYPEPDRPADRYVAQRIQESDKGSNTAVANNAAIQEGPVGSNMDANDRSKMMHALDNAPGKSTHWVNDNTGVSYTVVPTKKISLSGNPYCRTYETTAAKGDKEHKTYGTACVGTDGNWHPAKG